MHGTLIVNDTENRLREEPACTLRGGAVHIEGIAKSYGRVDALKDVSLSVEPGEFLALLGPSGSGKTTLLMAIAGFEMPDRGSIRIDGRDITSMPPNRRDLGMVFQRYALFPHMTLRDNIAFPLRMRGVGKAQRNARADEALATVGLDGYGDRLPAQLSGGQQQRVALARAIVYEPPVLLMDEPLSALDKNLREQMRLEIKHLQKRLGVTVIFVTHDQEEALVMADRIAVMRDGQLVQTGTPRDLYERPGSEFVAGFLGETNLLDADIVTQAADGLRLRLANGALIGGANTVGMAAAGQARVSIRPEAIALSHAPSDEMLAGRIDEVVYAGASVILLVDVGLSKPLMVRKTASQAFGALQQGQPVWLSWGTQDARVFARHEAA